MIRVRVHTMNPTIATQRFGFCKLIISITTSHYICGDNPIRKTNDIRLGGY